MDSIKDIGDANVSIDYLTNYRSEVICVFSVRVTGKLSIYLRGLDEATYRRVGDKRLPMFLLETLFTASVVRSFVEIEPGVYRPE
jgi:hypothetical protein